MDKRELENAGIDFDHFVCLGGTDKDNGFLDRPCGGVINVEAERREEYAEGGQIAVYCERCDGLSFVGGGLEEEYISMPRDPRITWTPYG